MIDVIGLGPGAAAYLTPRASRLIAACDWVIGSQRQLDALERQPDPQRVHLLDKSLLDLLAWLEKHQHEKVVVLASGDPMLYGIGRFLSTKFSRETLRIVPGISSIQYLFSSLGLDMNEVYLCSSHGKVPDFDFMLQHKKVALVTDERIGPYQLAEAVLQRGLQRQMVIGENLSYPDETITVCCPHEVVERDYAMNVVIIYQSEP